MLVRFFLPSILIGAVMAMSVADAGIIEKNIHDSSRGAGLGKPLEAGVSCQHTGARGTSFPQNSGSGLGLGAAYGLASLAVIAANAPLMLPVSHDDTWLPCDAHRIAKSSEGLRFATPAPASITE